MPLLPAGDGDLQRAIFEAIKAGSVSLVGNDGTVRAVQRPSDIAVGSPSLHLAKPKFDGSSKDAEGGTPTETEKRRASDKGTDDTAAPAADVQLGLTITTSLTDDERRNAVWKILNELAMRVDDKDASHIQLVVKVVVPSSKTETLIEQSKKAGATVNTTALE